MIFPGWRIVAGAFVILFTAYGAQYCFGVFFAALLAEFGWSRTGLSGVFSLYAFTYCVFGFPAGRLTDRWGPRIVIGCGALFLGGALAAMAAVTALWQAYVLYGVVAALGMGTAYVPCNTTVVRWFSRRRGLASGIASSGASLGTLVLPPLAQLTVGALGWRGAYVVGGAVVLVVLLFTAQVMRRDPATSLAFLPMVPKASLRNMTETLASPNVKLLIDSLKNYCDVIIVDMAPLISAVDVLAVSRFVDSYMLVIEWGTTKMEAVRHAVGNAPAVQMKMRGAVLNKVDFAGLASYEPHRQYHYYYGRSASPPTH